MTAAAMFRVAASRIEAGESYDSVLADYGWVEAATVDRLRATIAVYRNTRKACADCDAPTAAEIDRLRSENDALRRALQAALREQREVVVAAPRKP